MKLQTGWLDGGTGLGLTNGLREVLIDDGVPDNDLGIFGGGAEQGRVLIVLRFNRILFLTSVNEEVELGLQEHLPVKTHLH